jgi:hypothetical protein
MTKSSKKIAKCRSTLVDLTKNMDLYQKERNLKKMKHTLRSVTDYRKSMTLHNAMAEIKPLLMDSFPDHWEELYAMSKVRVNGYTHFVMLLECRFFRL